MPICSVTDLVSKLLDSVAPSSFGNEGGSNSFHIGWLQRLREIIYIQREHEGSTT